MRQEKRRRLERSGRRKEVGGSERRNRLGSGGIEVPPSVLLEPSVKIPEVVGRHRAPCSARHEEKPQPVITRHVKKRFWTVPLKLPSHSIAVCRTALTHTTARLGVGLRRYSRYSTAALSTVALSSLDIDGTSARSCSVEREIAARRSRSM